MEQNKSKETAINKDSGESSLCRGAERKAAELIFLEDWQNKLIEMDKT